MHSKPTPPHIAMLALNIMRVQLILGKTNKFGILDFSPRRCNLEAIWANDGQGKNI